ncbi:hypothetical protein XELAEV_18046128mg [Xenopus laevis]|uniref:Uncharacterized protein n=1 Tax=Xenopus laevis TaxID=8355 RepID=A0A974H0B0_XENLA|nr:hypothetical protein XELAEV_18046128mg [Xenopus laevis]
MFCACAGCFLYMSANNGSAVFHSGAAEAVGHRESIGIGVVALSFSALFGLYIPCWLHVQSLVCINSSCYNLPTFLFYWPLPWLLLAPDPPPIAGNNSPKATRV